MENNSVIVVGFSLASRDVETWHFEDDEFCEAFCKKLATETGKTVFVVSGQLLRKYEVNLPIVCTDLRKEPTQP